jgi:hypothetical protein
MDYFGRRKAIILAHVFYVIFTVILVMPSTVCFGIGRFMVGATVGIFGNIAPVYIGEITPIEMMPKVAPILYVNSGLGLLVAYAFGLMLPYEDLENDPNNDLWIFMFLFPTLISIYTIIYFFFCVKYDTPQFYMSRSRSLEAESALRVTHNESGISHGLRRVNSEIQGKTLNGLRVSMISMLRNKKFSKMIRFAIFFTLIQALSGITAIYFYSTSIFFQLGGGLLLARVFTLILGIINFISMLSGQFLLPCFGRKTLIVQSQFTISILLLLLGLFAGYLNVPPIIGAVFLLLYFVPFGYGLITTFYVYASEVLNDQLFTFFNILNFGFGVLVSLLFPISVQYIGLNNTFLILAGSTFVFGVLGYLYFIETKDKDKETILIEMKVISNEIIPQIHDNSELESPNDCEEDDENKDLQDEGAKLKEIGLNSTGFNDAIQAAE